MLVTPLPRDDVLSPESALDGEDEKSPSHPAASAHAVQRDDWIKNTNNGGETTEIPDELPPPNKPSPASHFHEYERDKNLCQVQAGEVRA